MQTPDAAVNHDPVAVPVYARNHPKIRHYYQYVWTAHPAWVTRGRPVGLLWASPDCTHHSKAKGASPDRSERRRDLAMVIADKWVPALKPRVIILENVEEFQDWGPLKDGKIVESAKGQKFREFCNRLRRYTSRVFGRYGSITDADITAAEEEDAAPPLPEGMDRASISVALQQVAIWSQK